MMNLRQMVIKGKLSYLDLGYLVAHLLEVAGGNANRDALIGQIRPTTLKKSLHTLQRLGILDSEGELSEQIRAELTQNLIQTLTKFNTSETKLIQNPNESSDFCQSFVTEMQKDDVLEQNSDKTQSKVPTFVEENGTEFLDDLPDSWDFDVPPPPPDSFDVPINANDFADLQPKSTLQETLDAIMTELKERKEEKEKEKEKEKERTKEKEKEREIEKEEKKEKLKEKNIKQEQRNKQAIYINNNMGQSLTEKQANLQNAQFHPNLASTDVLAEMKGEILAESDQALLTAKAAEIDASLPPSRRVRFDYRSGKFVGLFNGDLQILCSDFKISEKILLKELTKMKEWLIDQKERRGKSPVKNNYWRFIRNWLEKVEEKQSQTRLV